MTSKYVATKSDVLGAAMFAACAPRIEGPLFYLSIGLLIVPFLSYWYKEFKEDKGH